MKNIIMLTIDSLHYKHIKESDLDLMPFLKKLQNQGIYCENMFSQAPYTEAATMNLYCSQNVLDNGGYMFRYKNAPLTLFEAMREKGYKVYYNSFEPQCHPSSKRRGIDDIYYSVGYDFSAFWSYRFSHYYNLYHSGLITENDYEVLVELFKDNLNEWLLFTELIEKKDKSVEMIVDNSKDYDLDSVKAQVKNQLDEFNKNNIKYVERVLKLGKKHPLFSIPAYVQHNKTKDRSVVEFVRSEFKDVFQRIKKINLQRNIVNFQNPIIGPTRKLIEFIKKPNGETFKNFEKACYLSVNEYLDLDLMDRIMTDCDWFKNAPSARTHIDHFLKWSEGNKDHPFFACIHVNDVHNPEVFFTYDSSDKELLINEKKKIEEFLDVLPSNYKGSITHDLSLRYFDGVIEYLHSRLKEMSLDKDTCVVICADHGFSFSGYPLRDSFVVNMYLENYNVPFVITNSGRKNEKITKYCSTKDIPATICDIADGNVPAEFAGVSIFDNHEEKIQIIEYCGGGCPDIRRRELKIGAFNSDYFVATQGTLDDGLKITEIYDLKQDPLQFHNVSKKKLPNGAEVLVEAIEMRRKQIKEQMGK